MHCVPYPNHFYCRLFRSSSLSSLFRIVMQVSVPSDNSYLLPIASFFTLFRAQSTKQGAKNNHTRALPRYNTGLLLRSNQQVTSPRPLSTRSSNVMPAAGGLKKSELYIETPVKRPPVIEGNPLAPFLRPFSPLVKVCSYVALWENPQLSA